MAGSPCPVEVMKRVQSDMHMKVPAWSLHRGAVCIKSHWWPDNAEPNHQAGAFFARAVRM